VGQFITAKEKLQEILCRRRFIAPCPFAVLLIGLGIDFFFDSGTNFPGIGQNPRRIAGTTLARIAKIKPTARKSETKGGITMAKYGKKAAQKVKRAMHERKRGTLKSGRSGKKVTSRKQAIAIGLSEARRAGAKVPRKKSR
jgi:Family of unknown function (DUF6496)